MPIMTDTERGHVLFIIENNSVPFDKRVWAEAKSLKDIGFKISIITPRDSRSTNKNFEIIENINVYRHYIPAIEKESKIYYILEYINALFWEVILSLKIYFKKPFKIIHAGNPPDLIFLVAIIFKLLKVRFIYDQHDICPENYLAKFSKKDFIYKILRMMEWLTYKSADIVISTNESYKEIAIKRGKKKPHDVFVVRNGPDLKEIVSIPPNPKLKIGFNYLVVYTGTIGTQEGIDILIEIARYIIFEKKIKNIKFMIVGTGPNWGNMVEFSKKLGIENYVQFTGFIPYENFYEVLATADICVNPELKNDFTDKSTMIKILDYMTFGKPIVQFDVKEGKITAGESSIYVENNDYIAFAEAIIALLYDSEKRRRMGDIGKKRIFDSLSWDKQEENLRKAYEYLEKTD